MSFPILDRLFPIDPAGLLPAVTADNEVHWNGLQQGEYQLQCCEECSSVRYPIAPVCSNCGSVKWRWKHLSGRGTIFSWIRYHKSYLPEFQDLMPYAVAVIELEEGARVFGRLIENGSDVSIGTKVDIVIERWPDGRCVPAFQISARK